MRFRCALLAIGFCWFCIIFAPQAHSQSLPSGWTDQDVGTYGTAGSASFSNGVFTVTGAGQSFTYGTVDGFNFLYQQMSGDGYIIARVVSESNYPQAGVMIRETLNSGATNMVVMNAYNYTSSANFDSVSVSTSTNTPPQITNLSATEVTAGSQETITGTGFGSSQGNSLVLFNGTSLSVNS